MSRLKDWRARLAREHALRLKGDALYYGHRVYFPLRSHIFERAVRDGFYEPETVELLLRLAIPGATYIDVGANIGLLSAPILSRNPGARVISIEASPETLPYLRRTQQEAGTSDWTLVEAAVGDRMGEVDFWASESARGAFDGLKDTGRGGAKTSVKVPMRTLDDIWTAAGRPEVSVIKIDIEGGESMALKGAKELIGKTRPALVIEWSAMNLPAYGVAPETLFDLCGDIGYVAYAFPSLVRIDHPVILRFSMPQTETFLLLPAETLSA